jgi:hypothetical protein
MREKVKELGIQVSLTIVPYFVVGQTAHLVLRPLASYPFTGFLLRDVVALHHPLNAQRLWSRDNNRAIDKTVQT